jgi:hypothetical protein
MYQALKYMEEVRLFLNAAPPPQQLRPADLHVFFSGTAACKG